MKLSNDVDSRDIKYDYGVWVMYCPVVHCETGESEWQIGRVVEDMGAAARVCYHAGCTSAVTQKDFLRPATDEEVMEHLAQCRRDSQIGYYRFMSYCPDIMHDVCAHCIHYKELEVY